MFRRPTGPLVHRQTIWTRLTHWTWAVALIFLALSGMQILYAHPALYIGQESGFGFDNAIARFEEIPAALRVPSTRDLATGRTIHFFFAWIFVAAGLVWLVAGLLTRHVWRDVVPKGRDLAALPRDVADHARLRLHNARTYSPLQKLSYAAVLFVLFPGMIVTGLAMSPGFNAVAPWLNDVLGGRQTARTLHFAGLIGLTAFLAVHLVMVVLAGPLNELRSMVTGWFRIDAEEETTR